MTSFTRASFLRAALASIAVVLTSCASSNDDCESYKAALLAYAECDPLATPVNAIPDGFHCRPDSERLDAGVQLLASYGLEEDASELLDLRECTALLKEHAASCVELRWNRDDPDETIMEESGALRDRRPELRAKLRQCAFSIPNHWQTRSYTNACEAWKEAVERYTTSCDPRFTPAPDATCVTDAELAASAGGNSVQSCATLIADRSYPLCQVPLEEAGLCIEGVARD